MSGTPSKLAVPVSFPTAASWIRSPSERPSSLGTKRRYDDYLEDVVYTPAGSIASGVSSGGSYTTRRKRVQQGNARARLNEANRLKYKPEFDHIQVEASGTYLRSYKPGLSFAAPDPQVQEYVRTHGLPKGVQGPQGSCFMSSCDDAQMRHLKYFDRPAREAPLKHAECYEQAKGLVKELLELPEKLPFPHAEDLDTVRYKSSKFPGSVYRNMGFKNRGEAQETALSDARLAWSSLMMGEDVRPHAVRLGGRGKAMMMSEEQARKEGVPKGRLVLMLSQRDLLLNGVVEQRLTEKYCSDAYPMSLGLGWFGGNPSNFVSRYFNHEKFFCFDAEKFDSSIDPYMVLDAIDILRGQFEDGYDSKYDAYWEFVAESLVLAPIERDDGWVFKKSCGTTSGHNFNTLVQSVITLLLGWTTALSLVGGELEPDLLEDLDMESLGDDNMLATRGMLEPFTCDEVAERMLEIFGISWLGDKSYATFAMCDIVVEDDDFQEEEMFQGVQYLGKHFRGIRVDNGQELITTAIPYRRVQETFTHLYYPESRGREKRDTYLRALGNLLDCYGNPWAAVWVNGLLDVLGKELETLPQGWEADMAERVAKTYRPGEVTVPVLKRWTFDEWVLLVLWSRETQRELYETIDTSHMA